MSTDYKNLFNKKKDYSNLFSDTNNDKHQDSKMAYKNLFGSTEPDKKEETKSTESDKKYGSLFGSSSTKSKPVFPQSEVQEVKPPKHNYIPERKVDPRFSEIASIDPNVPGNTVIMWLDNFEHLLSELGTNNQKLADEELALTQQFINERSSIQVAFTGIKELLSTIQAPEKKKGGLISKFFGSNESDFTITREMIDNVSTGIHELIKTQDNKQRYGGKIFLKSKLDQLDIRIRDIKLNAQCAYVACKYLADRGDYKAEVRLERIAKINQIIQISELALNDSYKKLSLDIEKYEDLKQTTVPLLYIKLQNLMNNTLDPDAMNLINKINEL